MPTTANFDAQYALMSGVAAHARLRGRAQQRPATRRPEMGQRVLERQERAERVDLERLLELGTRELGERGQAEDAGVGDARGQVRSAARPRRR